MNVVEVSVLKIAGKNDVVTARQHIASVASDYGMSRMKETELRTAASELLSNMLKYGGGGTVTVEKVEHDGSLGLRITFVDEGPGIADVNAALSQGFSTGNSLGHGLSGCRNLVDAFDLRSELGKGTQVVITKWNG